MIGILLLAAVGVSSGPTLGQWSVQDEESRRIVLTGAVEGILLSTSAQNGAAVPVNTDCFSTVSPDVFDAALLRQAKASPGRSLVEALIGMEQCVRKGAAK